eukprot:618875-Hanusia_phi.AAC.1
MTCWAGYELQRSSAEGRRRSREYNDSIRLNTVRYAMLEHLRHPPVRSTSPSHSFPCSSLSLPSSDSPVLLLPLIHLSSSFL